MNDPFPTIQPPSVSTDGATIEPVERIGRYRVKSILGQGGFGLVYLAYDDQLQRLVAVKVPHSRLVSRAEDAEAYLVEARTVANLDHPNIVPVYDVGGTPEYPCFVVSKYVEGTTLAGKISRGRCTAEEAVDLTEPVAKGVYHAHRQGLVHRDVKPGNILLDTHGKAYLCDFGLALREQDIGKEACFAGTPAYMSPEQARGEGHRIDGRSDIFSLGVVFYELLTGQRPFEGESVMELLIQITKTDPRPPRQLDERIPAELERICLKALAKRASERYATARDMADDLRHFLPATASLRARSGTAIQPGSQPATPASSVPKQLATSAMDHASIQVVPKGLRSFDAKDADFFLGLVPGPRDREGLPDSLRFWKSRIQETDPDDTFSAGLIYGPSGCGKSSLVKAGLLPCLSDDILVVYVEANADDTEARLLNGLRKKCPDLPAQLGLKESMAALRRGQGLQEGKRVLIVLDQFEQWLHAKRQEQNTEMMQALRQCDFGRLRCLLLVRDDFWLAVSRFMRDLEVDLLPGRNIALVDLFDLDHAGRVLAALGRAFGRLPAKSSEISKQQQEFLIQAVAGLAQENKVIPVRLALFAEMVKGRPWTAATLKEIGGAGGVGVAFLEETFSSPSANPRHRLHQKAARAVLKALLPATGGDIRGHMRSHAELLEASEYAGQFKEFDDLIRVLDAELRLITPTDPEGAEAASLHDDTMMDATHRSRKSLGSTASAGSVSKSGLNVKSSQHESEFVPVSLADESESVIDVVLDSPPETSAPAASAKYYQLTHDFLVPALLDWLTRKQKETRRGRAELLLAERATEWNARPDNRQLPSLSQWLRIRLLTRKKNWTPPQRKMMQKATRHHAVRGCRLAVLLLAGALVCLLVRDRIAEQNKANHAAGLVQALVKAATPQSLDIVGEMEGYRKWTDPLLREEFEKAPANSRRQLHVSLALLPVDPGQVEYLYARLLDADPPDVPVIRDALEPHKESVQERLWKVAERPEQGKETQRLRAAATLAKYDSDSKRWDRVSEPVANDLVRVPFVYLAVWMESFRRVSDRLQAPLQTVYRDPRRRETERALATDLLAEFAAKEPHVLADLLMDADEKQFALLYPRLLPHGDIGMVPLRAEVDQKLPVNASNDAKEKLAKRQANAAVALLRMNQPESVWRLLKRGPEPDDPRVRSYLIHLLGPLGADAAVLVNRLNEEADETVRRALLLSLGPEEFAPESWKPQPKLLLVQQLQEMYRAADDPGLHAAAEWLLFQLGEKAWLRQTDAAWAKNKDQALRPKTRWYVNSQGQTMIVIPGPVDRFTMGSPAGEAGRAADESLHEKRIGRAYALASKPVTVDQFQSYYKMRFGRRYTFPEEKKYAPDGPYPMVNVSWFDAAAYCNWLSEQEHVAKCYEEDNKGNVTGLKKDYLKRTGYRLPTEAEWEYACRAGAATSRHYGETAELLGKYAWFSQNSNDHSWPVAGKKPNDFGLFDMHGNVCNWCQESYKAYPKGDKNKVYDDVEDVLTINSKESRVMRGASYNIQAASVRSAFRGYFAPTFHFNIVGFRPARTLRSAAAAAN